MADRVGSLVLGLGIVAGIAVGVGSYTFGYARGASYLTNDPAACANCHVMREQYDGWLKSSHHGVAVCNDCHTPHAFLPKYWVKARNGFWHSFYFTTGDYLDPIQITERNRKIANDACRKCHAGIAETIEGPATKHSVADTTSCIRCHRNVGHMH